MGERVVLAVDPGRGKCGVAVCSDGRVLAKTIVAQAHLPDMVREWIDTYGVTSVVVGNLTGSGAVLAALGDLGGVPVTQADEAGTTLLARARYFAEHPPRGWRRLVPLGLQTPPEPYDDYVAVLLAERALGGTAGSG
jgi:RNase H-fold protein (predicted Holliday junction resolvase)